MQYVAQGYFAYVNESSFAYPEHLVHGGVAKLAYVARPIDRGYWLYLWKDMAHWNTALKLEMN